MYTKNSKLLFSFIVPAKNAEDSIRSTIESILAQTGSSFEIIVVVNGSSDRTFEIVKKFPMVRCLQLKKSGRGFARNKGAQLARAEYLAFVDSDVTLHKSWLRYVSSYLRSYSVDAVATSIMPIPEMQRGIADLFRFEILNWRSQGSFLSNMGPDGVIPLLSPAACVVKSGVFFKLKGFKNNLHRNEDVDFSKRLVCDGYLLGAVSKAMAYDRYVTRYSFTRSLTYLTRTFEARYHHYHPSWREVLTKSHMISAMSGRRDLPALQLYSVLNQLSFNLGAAANRLFNPSPLNLDFFTDVKPKVNHFYFWYQKHQYFLRREIKVILVDKTFYYFFKSGMSKRCSSAEAFYLRSLMTEKKISERAKEQLILNGLFARKS